MLCAARSAVFFGVGGMGYPWPLESPAALRQAAWRPLTVPWDLPPDWTCARLSTITTLPSMIP